MATGSRKLQKKICLLGDFAVGKTSLVRRFVEGRFDEKYLSTIGVKVDRKVLHLPSPHLEEEKVELTFMLWDLAGGPEFSPVVPSYYRGSAGAILTCDLTRPETLAGLERYVQGFLDANPSARLIMAANKADLVEERGLSDESLNDFATANRFPLFVTSAKTGELVEEMFRQLGTLILTGAGDREDR
jgi:small GTP-binding protein